MRLATVEEAGERLRVTDLTIKDLWDEVQDRWSHIFVVDHVKTCNQIRIGTAIDYSVNHLEDVRAAYDFQTCDYKS
jgi:hypothetical protein